MNKFRFITIIFVSILLISCSNAMSKLDAQSPQYQWQGERYGVIEVEVKDALKDDNANKVLLSQLNLQPHIIARLIRTNLYDIESTNVIRVTLDTVAFKRGRIPKIARIFTGSDVVTGTVKLISEENEIASFNINIEYDGSSRGTHKYAWVGRSISNLISQSIVHPVL